MPPISSGLLVADMIDAIRDNVKALFLKVAIVTSPIGQSPGDGSGRALPALDDPWQGGAMPMPPSPAPAAPARTPRPGGRTARNSRAVAQAVLELLSEGKTDFALQDVAARAGVHRTTLFRRWPDRAALVAEALALHRSRVPPPPGDGWHGQYRHVAFAMRTLLSDPVEIALIRQLASGEHPLLARRMAAHWEEVIARFAAPIHAAIARGEAPSQPDPTLGVRMIVSTVTALVLFGEAMPDDELLERIAAQVAPIAGEDRTKVDTA